MGIRYRQMTCRYASSTGTSVEQLAQRDWQRGIAASFAPTLEWRPNAEVYETARALVVRVELAGMAEDKIVVNLFEDALVVQGVRDLGREPEGSVRFHEATIPHGPFRVGFCLPLAVDRNQVTAEYRSGILEITLPRVPATDVPIETGGKGNGTQRKFC